MQPALSECNRASSFSGCELQLLQVFLVVGSGLCAADHPPSVSVFMSRSAFMLGFVSSDYFLFDFEVWFSFMQHVGLTSRPVIFLIVFTCGLISCVWSRPLCCQLSSTCLIPVWCSCFRSCLHFWTRLPFCCTINTHFNYKGQFVWTGDLCVSSWRIRKPCEALTAIFTGLT